MTKKPITNVAASVRQRLLNQARVEKRTFQELAQLYAMERFLFRLAASEHADQFVLKGGLVTLTWAGDLDPVSWTPAEWYDNAVMESWFGTFKTELGEDFESYADAHTKAFDYIEAFYNGEQLRSTFGYLSPRDFERQAAA